MTVVVDTLQKGELVPIIVTIRKRSDDSIYDLSEAILKNYVFKSPTGDVSTKECSFVTNGSDGKLVYVLQEGDVDEVGVWYFQAEVTWSDSRRKTPQLSFTIEEDLAL